MMFRVNGKTVVNYWVIPSLKTTYTKQEFALEVVKIVAEITGVEEELILSRNREEDVSFARHLCFYLITKHTNFGWSLTGRLMNRDHSSVIHGHNKIDGYVGVSWAVDENYKINKAEIKLKQFLKQYAIK